MKRSMLVVVLTLGSLLTTPPGFNSGGGIRADSQSNQNNRQEAESSRQVKEEQKPVFDMNGKRLRADERYVAERTLRNGRIIAYRRNEREIAALVKALKKDGVTDKELLNPKTWMMIICDKSSSSGCQGGCTPTRSCQLGIYHTERTTKGRLPQAVSYGSCSCK
jgi:hypothetical protein